VSYIITDIDGTLTTSGDTPNQPYIDWLKSQANDFGAEVIVVSARPISRLAETERWLEENLVPYKEIHLQDFGESNPAVNEAFKAYKYSKLQEEYGDEIAFLVDNDAEARDAAEGMGILAYTPDEAMALTVDDGESADEEMRVLIDVPEYIQTAAAKGITYFENGFAGDGLQPETVEEARQLRAGQAEDEKVTRMRAWILRHRQDWEGVERNNNPQDENFPGPGAVAAYLWGVDPTAENGTDRVLQWADGVLAPLETEERFDVKELETRALPMGDFTVTEGEDGQKTFVGYAALFGAPSAGLPFTEVIAPGAFRRTLSRVADGKKIVSFLFGHDETRALATTASGRLALTEDERGLKVEARLDPADPDAAGVISKLTHEARAMGMSFGFTIPKNGDEWDEDTRTLREVNLFEVSVLSAGQTPAYPATLGLTSVRKVASRMGVDGDRLISAIESIKSATPLTAEDVEVIDTVREKLAPKSEAIDPSIAEARLVLARMESESL
jgi:HK97 family phage prohead protease